MTDADYVDDLALLTNTPAEAEFQLLSLDQVAEGISVYVNTIRTEFICFKQEGAICTQNSQLLNQFTYHGSNVSSTERDVNIHQAKTWNTFDETLITWKSNLSNKIK